MAHDELWSDIIPKFVKLPYLAYKHRRFVQYWAYRGLVAAGWGKSDVAVVGRASVGKTVLTERLRGLPGNVNWGAPGLSRAVESAVLRAGPKPLIVRTIPGQVSRERDAGIHEIMSTHNDLEGIIYVADWGYTETRDATIRQSLIENDKLDDVEKIRATNLAAEVRDFEDITLRIRESHGRCGRPLWLLIVVNKVDLFMDRLDEVQSYYHPDLNSDFTAPLHRLRKQIGMDNLRCDAIPVSSWGENFEWNGDVVKSNLNEGDARLLFQNLEQKVAGLSNATG